MRNSTPERGTGRQALADVVRAGTVIRAIAHVQKRKVLFHRTASTRPGET
jgi:hypothetical protein